MVTGASTSKTETSKNQNNLPLLLQGRLAGHSREGLFVSQRDQGVDARGAARGDIARGERHKRKQYRYGNHR